jgi:hypothetical protein
VLKDEWFLPYKIGDFLTIHWEREPFDGEIWRAKQQETDYGGILFRELNAHGTPQGLVRAYKLLIPELQSERQSIQQSIKLTRSNLQVIYQEALRKEGLGDNHHAKGTHITQVIKELQRRYLSNFIAKPTTRHGVSGSYYTFEFKKPN